MRGWACKAQVAEFLVRPASRLRRDHPHLRLSRQGRGKLLWNCATEYYLSSILIVVIARPGSRADAGSRSGMASTVSMPLVTAPNTV